MSTDSKVPGWLSASLVPVMLAMVPAIGGVAVTSYQVDDLSTKVARLDDDIHDHEELHGHPVAMERVSRIEERLNKLDETTNKKIDRALSALSRVCGKLNVDCGL